MNITKKIRQAAKALAGLFSVPFGKKVENIEKLKESVTTHCLSAAEKIRADDQLTKSVTVFIRTSPFDKYREYYSNSITIDLPIATSNSIELIRAATEGLKTIYKYGKKKKKTGIILSNLSDAKKEEFNLLTPLLETKPKSLMKAIDYTNIKYGRNAISVLQAGINNSWKTRREHFSRIDTASFENLPTLKI